MDPELANYLQKIGKETKKIRKSLIRSHKQNKLPAKWILKDLMDASILYDKEGYPHCSKIRIGKQFQATIPDLIKHHIQQPAK
jgi:hypothetical protein